MSIEHEAVERIARVLALHELAPAYAECTHDIPDFCVPVKQAASGIQFVTNPLRVGHVESAASTTMMAT